MNSTKKEPKEVYEDTDDEEEEANIPPPPEFGSINLISYTTEQSHTTKFPVGCSVWADVKSDGAHLSWNEGVVHSVLFDIMTRETVYRVRFSSNDGDEGGIINVDSDDDIAVQFQNLWERQLSYAIGCTVNIQSSSDTSKWSIGTIVFQNPGPPNRRTYAVRVSASSSIELKVTEPRIRYPKICDFSKAKANVSRGESGMQAETKGPASEVITTKDGSEVSSLAEVCQSGADQGLTRDARNAPAVDEISESEIGTRKRHIEGHCISTDFHSQTEGSEPEKPPSVGVEESSVRLEVHRRQDGANEQQHENKDVDRELLKSVECIDPSTSFDSVLPAPPRQQQKPDTERKGQENKDVDKSMQGPVNPIEDKWQTPSMKRKSTPVGESSIRSNSNERPKKITKMASVVNEPCVLAVSSWAAKCQRPYSVSLYGFLIGDGGSKIRRFQNSTNCSISLMPRNWKKGDSLRVCIKARPGKSDIARAKDEILESMMQFITDASARERLRHEVMFSEQGPLSCKESNGCIFVLKNGTMCWSRLVEVTPDPKGKMPFKLPFIPLGSGCFIKVYRGELGCKPFILVYGPDPSRVNQAAGKVQEAIRGLVDSNEDTFLNARSYECARSSPDKSFERLTAASTTNPELMTKTPLGLLEVKIPRWVFFAKIRVYDHIFGTAPDALAALLAQAGCTISRGELGSLAIRSDQNSTSVGQMFHLVEDSLLQILKIENDDQSTERLLYELSEQTRRNSPYQRHDVNNIMQTRNTNSTRHHWWTWTGTLPTKKHADETVEYHGSFLGKLRPPGVHIVVYLGPKLCEPYVLVKGPNLKQVEWAVKFVKDEMIRHQQNCGCIPKWE